LLHAAIVARFLALSVFAGFKSSRLFPISEIEDGAQAFCHRYETIQEAVIEKFKNIAETDYSRDMGKSGDRARNRIERNGDYFE